MRGYRILVSTLALAALALAPACRNTAEGVKDDSRQNAEKAREGAQSAKVESTDTAHKVGADAKETGSKIGQEAKEAGSKIGQAAKEVGATVKQGARDVASDAGAGKQTVAVKTALVAAKGIDATHIDVDTDAGAKTVTLKGTVPTADQKAAAERVARDTAEGYRVRNLLTVTKG